MCFCFIQGNFYNFRNEHFNSFDEEMTMSKEFLSNLPSSGVLEFDFVSTTRPKLTDNRSDNDGRTNTTGSTTKRNRSANRGESDDDFDEEGNEEERNSDDDSDLNSDEDGEGKDKDLQNNRANKAESVFDGVSVTDEQFDEFVEQLELSTRHRLSKSLSIYKLLELQIAVTKYYFPVNCVIKVLDAFCEDPLMQARVVVCMFSRIKDLHNFDYVMRHLNSVSQQEVLLRLGCLNCINPLKPSFDFALSLKYLDCRVLVMTLMELSSAENGDNIKDDPRSDIPIISLYGSMTRLVNDVRPEVLRFSFCEVGERTQTVAWPLRRDVIKRFLVGTNPMDKNMFKIITLYREMEAAGTLGRGPIDLQYLNHLKTQKLKSRKLLLSNKGRSPTLG